MKLRRQRQLLAFVFAILMCLSAAKSRAAGDSITPENAKNLKEIAVLEADAGEVYSLAVSKDSKLIASGHEDGTIHLWDAATHKDKATFKSGMDETTKSTVDYLKFLPDNRLFLMSRQEKLGQLVGFWDLKSTKLTPFGQEKFGLSLVQAVVGMSDDGTVIAQGDCGNQLSFNENGMGCIKRGIRFQETKSEKEISFFEPAIEDGLWAVSISPDNKWAVVTGEDGIVRVIDVKTGKLAKPLAQLKVLTLGSAFSKDGAMIAVASVDGFARIWNMKTRAVVASLKANATAAVTVAFSPDGKLLAVAGEDKIVRLWDVKTKKQVVTLKNHTGIVTGLAFTPDGTILISAALDGKVRVWGFE
jgi:WD40 repeat protein